MSGLWNIGLWIFAFYFIWKSIQYLLDLRRIFHIRDFYVHLLNIPECDMQTVTWQEIVARVMALRDHNPKTATSLTRTQRRFLGSQSKERLDASDIANRLMRRENYLIALFNKDILNLTIPLPFLQNQQLLSRTLEWCLMFSILDFVFDEQGQVNQEFLKSDRRRELSLKLRARFVFAGVMVLILSPFLTAYLVIVYFLTYYNVSLSSPPFFLFYTRVAKRLTGRPCNRSTRRTHPPCHHVPIPPWQSGSFGNSMSFPIFFGIGSICHIPSLLIT